MLAVTSYADNIFELNTMLLDGSNLEPRPLHRQIFEGDVKSLGICNIGGKAHAVACLWRNNAVYLDLYSIQDKTHVKTISMQSLAGSPSADEFTRGSFTNIEPFTSIVPVIDDPANSVLIAGSRDGLLLTLGLDSSYEVTAASLEKVGLVPAYVYEAPGGSAFVCCDESFTLIGDYQGGTRGFAKRQSIWTVDANDSSKLAPRMTSVVVLHKSFSGNPTNKSLLLLAKDHVLLAELQPEVGPVQRQMPLGMTPQKMLYSHVLKCLVVGARTLDDRPTLKFIDPDTGEDLSLPLDGQTKEPTEFISGLGKTGDRILCLDEWHIQSKNKNFYHIVVTTHGGPSDGGRVMIVSTQPERPGNGESRGRIPFFTRHRIKGSREPVHAVATAGHKIQATFHSELVYYELDDIAKKLNHVSTTLLDSEAWRLSVLPNSPYTLALTRCDSLCVLEEGENEGDGFEVCHIDPYTPHGLDMLEVAGAWPPPLQKAESTEPPPSIVLITDQACGLNGRWIPWDSPGNDCEVLFEADLPSTVRRLRLGRTLPSWSREARKGRQHGGSSKRFGLLAASVNDAEILGMGIDGSLQHFTLLDLGAWRFLRFLQNISETSQELYPFTYMQFGTDEEKEAFDPRPLASGSGSGSGSRSESVERQVDGDLMRRILDGRVLERLVWSRREWVGYFMEYLDGVDGGQWTQGFRENRGDAGDGDDDGGGVSEVDKNSETGRAYLGLAYEILEYFLVPII
ncbi:hypothetical protein DHEL01_v202453 [Diaporthe helianthi]|uniref:Thermotolerance protein n=1 Tax=Diaporthe helianthi TaxID=158607 RepID=A0A2P5I9H3_DIAHE|nr:hypothetical protein DHEL01_v202453 [Diaporthe helianthi]